MSTIDLTDDQAGRVAAAGGRVVPVQIGAAPAPGDLADVEVWLGEGLTEAVLQMAPRLAWVQSTSQGVDGILFDELARSDVVVTNVRGMHASVTSEHALALVLGMARALPQVVLAQRERAWATVAGPDLRIIDGSRMVVLGTGAIGRAFARRAGALGAHLIGVNRRGTSVEGFEKTYREAELSEVAATADWLVLVCPLTSRTRGIVGARVLERMRPSSYLVNVSRGPVLDSAALLDALARGRPAGAALDVFDEEPLAASHPFWTMPNVLVSPHLGGVMPGYMDRAVTYFADNLRRFRGGEPLASVVDKGAGY